MKKKAPVYDWCKKNIDSEKDGEMKNCDSGDNLSKENMNNKKAELDTGNSESDDGLSRRKIKAERDVDTKSGRSDDNLWEANIKVEEDAVTNTNSDFPNSDMDNRNEVKQENIFDPEGEKFSDIKTEEIILKSEDEGSRMWCFERRRRSIIKDKTLQTTLCRKQKVTCKKVSCDVCGKLFRDNFHMNQHKNNIHSSTYHHKCELCDCSFRVLRALTRHVYTKHENRYKHSCEICKRVFGSKRSRDDHHMTVHENYRFRCEQCGKQFSSRNGFKEHTKGHNPSFKKEYKCSECEKIYYSIAYYRRHLRIHAGSEETLVCDICGKHISHNQGLKKHMTVHTGEKAYICGVCGNKFKAKSGLTKHELIHSNVKPHVCTICKKSFRQRVSLVIHMRRHTGEKPYTCSICSVSFVCKSGLNDHKCKGPL